MSGGLRCLHGKVDNIVSCVCMYVLLVLPSGLSAWLMALVLWLPLGIILSKNSLLRYHPMSAWASF